MLLGTHILLPVIPLALRRYRAIKKGDEPVQPLRELFVVGIFGALPDLLNPHLSLESRLSSWSHGLPFVACLATVLLLACIPKRSPLTLARAGYLLMAYVLHLLCDALSGGIAYLYPLNDQVIGAAYIPPGLWWFLSDFVHIMAAYMLLRILPMLARQRLKNQGIK